VGVKPLKVFRRTRLLAVTSVVFVAIGVVFVAVSDTAGDQASPQVAPQTVSEVVLGLKIFGVASIALGISALRSFKITLWPDKLKYHHLLWTKSYPKNSIMDIGADTRSGGRAMPSVRLYLKLTNGKVLWLKEIGFSYSGQPTNEVLANNAFIADQVAQKDETLDAIRQWLHGSATSDTGQHA
jgi:hypothetical protein